MIIVIIVFSFILALVVALSLCRIMGMAELKEAELICKDCRFYLSTDAKSRQIYCKRRGWVFPEEVADCNVNIEDWREQC